MGIPEEEARQFLNSEVNNALDASTLDKTEEKEIEKETEESVFSNYVNAEAETDIIPFKPIKVNKLKIDKDYIYNSLISYLHDLLPDFTIGESNGGMIYLASTDNLYFSLKLTQNKKNPLTK